MPEDLIDGNVTDAELQMLTASPPQAENKPAFVYFFHRVTHKVYTSLEQADIRNSRRDPQLREISASQAAHLTNSAKDYAARFAQLRNKHQGDEIHIFGNGPSLNKVATSVDWSTTTTIGVNAAPLAIPSLTYWMLIDPLIQPNRALHSWLANWYQLNHGPLSVVNRSTVDLLESKQPDYVFSLSEPEEAGLYWSGSSVHAALNLAIRMGARKVYLWGLDYATRDHFYTAGAIISDSKDLPGQPWLDFSQHEAGFLKLKQLADKKGVEVVNCNPDSCLRVFPFFNPQVFLPFSPPVSLPVNVEAPPPDENRHDVRYDFTQELIEVFRNGQMTIIPFSELKANPKLKHLLNPIRALKLLPEA